MREIGIGGAVVLVDPRAEQGTANAMRKLLTDDARLTQLRQEVAERTYPTWAEYSVNTWEWLIEGKAGTSKCRRQTDTAAVGAG